MANKKSNNARSKSARSKNAKSSSSNNCSSARSSKAKNSNNALDNMKYEIAKEFGVNLGASSSARANGSVGGEMTKRLIEKGRNSKSRSNK